MVARAGFYALTVSAALVTASGAGLTDEAMAQSGDVAVQAEATAEAAVATPQTDDVTMQDEAVEQPVPRHKPAKSDLDQSAVRAAPVTRSPRPTRTSTRAIAVPKILGSYR